MIPSMFRRFLLGFSLLLALSAAGYAQSSGAVLIDADMRFFTTMVALNAAGFDVELGAQYHPVRIAARNLGEKLDPDLRRRLREFYEAHKKNETDEAQLSKYISLVVMATAPPELKLSSRVKVLPP